jgi:hypothetical protein
MTGAKVQKLTPRYWYKSAKTDAEGDAVGKKQDDRQVYGRLQLNIFDLHNVIAAKQAERMALLEFKVKFDEKGTQSTYCTITSTKVKKLTQSEIRRKRYSVYLLYEYKKLHEYKNTKKNDAIKIRRDRHQFESLQGPGGVN